MFKRLLMLAFIFSFTNVRSQVDSYNRLPYYAGKDLGLNYSPISTSIKLWSPIAEAAELVLYRHNDDASPMGRFTMRKTELGTWTAKLEGNRKGLYYTVRIRQDGQWKQEVVDPYAKCVGMNGKKAMIVDLRDTDPVGWRGEMSPAGMRPTDAIVYELHVRDASIAVNSGIGQKGKFLGLTEKGTRNAAGEATGLDHLKELGVTHVHLLPFFDFMSINEARPDSLQYNWGYDPLNYNVPEGSYASNAADPLVRIRELKQLIATFHRNGLRVVMDVVYNHTGQTESSAFNQLVPGYYYRQAADGSFSNATACGNETASERPMMRKFMLESLKYWVKEFHVDGFRFDLMGVHDIETMNIISRELHKLKPGILLYGEGWTAGASPLPEKLRAVKANGSQLEGIAVFSDDIRDGIKGSVFRESERGFATGQPGTAESIKFGVVGACYHVQVDYSKVNYSKKPYSKNPSGTISYADCHDNHTLWDKIVLSTPEVTGQVRKEMYKLALSIVLTSQGVSFLHAGSEFMRSKKGHENSYNAGDSINAIDWDLKTVNGDVYDLVRTLIDMRRKHPAFRMATGREVAKNIRFEESVAEGVVDFTIDGKAVGDSWTKLRVVYNGGAEAWKLKLGRGWKVFLESNKKGEEKEFGEEIMMIAPYSCSILFK